MSINAKQESGGKILKVNFIPMNEACKSSGLDDLFNWGSRIQAVMDSSNLFTLDQQTRNRMLNYGIVKERTTLFRWIKKYVNAGVIAMTDIEDQYMVNPHIFSNTSAVKREINISTWGSLLRSRFNNSIKTTTKTKRKPQTTKKADKPSSISYT